MKVLEPTWQCWFLSADEPERGSVYYVEFDGFQNYRILIVCFICRPLQRHFIKKITISKMVLFSPVEKFRCNDITTFVQCIREPKCIRALKTLKETGSMFMYFGKCLVLYYSVFLTQKVIYSLVWFGSRSCGIPAADNLFMFGLFSKCRLAGKLKRFAEFAIPTPSHEAQVVRPPFVLYLALHTISLLVNTMPKRQVFAFYLRRANFHRCGHISFREF